MTVMEKPAQPDKKSSALERLHAGVKALLEAGEWKAALEAQRRFHPYSFRNVLLIFAQRPDATRVAGYTTWKALGRQVKKGEHGIIILAPMVGKAEDGEKAVRGFRAAHVFDLSQTEGLELPQRPEPQQLEGDEAKSALYSTLLEGWLFSQGYILERCALPLGASGMYHAGTRKICLLPNLSPLQALKTLLHEASHALMHGPCKDAQDRQRAELEAESCAYLVCAELGLDASRYSFAYLAQWASAPEALLEAGQKAARAAKVLLVALAPVSPSLETEMAAWLS